MGFQGVAATGQAWVRHEVFLRVEGGLAFLRRYAPRGSVWQYFETLLVVHQVSEHDLAQNLLVDGGIGDRYQRLDATVEVTRHDVGRGDVDDRPVARQLVAVAEAVDA